MKVVTLDGAGERLFALLTRQERQILRPLSNGQMNKEIAYQLGVSESTVKGHIAQMLAKGHFGNRLQLARWAMLHPHVFSAGYAVELNLHQPGCPCDHPRCTEMRELDAHDKAA